MKASDKLIKAFEKFNDELKAFGEETGEVFVTLYEDINTTRRVCNFKLYKNGKLTWLEINDIDGKSRKETYEHIDDYDIKDTLSFWRLNLRKAKRYWATDSDTLDAMADGEIDDIE